MKVHGTGWVMSVMISLMLAVPGGAFAMMHGMGHGMEEGKGSGMMGPGMHGGPMPGGQMSGEMMPGTMPMIGRGHVTGYASPLDMKEDLKLTPDQTAKLKPIHAEYRKATIRKSAEIKVANLELEELLDAKKIDFAKVEKQAKAVEALKTDLLLYRIKTLQKIQGVLTAEQFEKYRAKARRHMPHGMGPGMGMMGGMGPGMMCPMMQMMQQMMGGMMGPGMMGHGRPQPEKKAPAPEKGAPPAKEDEHKH